MTVPESNRSNSILQFAALLVVVLVARLTFLDRPPKYDEFYHVLAARSVLDDGSLSINGGEYLRARGFTMLVAASMAVFGDNLIAARLPALVAGVLWVLLVFGWTRSRCGTGAAWIAALLMGFAPTMMFLSQHVRFYSLHGLLIWIAAICTYSLLRDEWSSRRAILRLTTLVVSLLAALHLQDTTMVAILALATWAGLHVLYDAWRSPDERRRRICRRLAIAGAIVSVAALLVGWGTGLLGDVLTRYRWAPLWAAEDQIYPRYYYDHLLDWYHVLWTLYPAALVIAYTRRAAPTLFVLTMFGLPFLLHSFAGAKEPRYLAYALPFFFVAWGVAIEGVLGALLRVATEAARRFFPGPRMTALHRPAAFAAVLFCVLFTLYNARWCLLSGRILKRSPREHYVQWESEWERTLPRLRELADEADVVIVTSGPKAIYYLGDYDLELNPPEYASSLQNLRDEDPGTGRPLQVMDYRLGRPVTDTKAGLQAMMESNASGLVIVEKVSWKAPWGVSPELAEFIEDHLERIELPEEAKLYAFRWSADAPASHDAPKASP